MAQGSVVFDQAVEYYDQTRGFPPGIEPDIARLFIEAGGLTSHSRLLEVGVGTGRIALPLAPHVESITGLDLSLPMMLKLVGKRTTEPIRLVQADATQLPFKSAVFDAVTAVHFFHLVPTWREVLTELKRVLRPDGLLLHGWNHRDADNELDAVWKEAVGTSRGGDIGVSFDQRVSFLPENGWAEVGEERSVAFTTSQSPQQYIDALRSRRWSQTWRMSDEQLNKSAGVIEAYISEHYPDPSVPVSFQSSFHVRAYKRT